MTALVTIFVTAAGKFAAAARFGALFARGVHQSSQQFDQ